MKSYFKNHLLIQSMRVCVYVCTACNGHKYRTHHGNTQDVHMIGNKFRSLQGSVFMVELSSCVNMQFTFEIRFYFVPSEITSLEAYRLCEYVVATCLGVRSISAPF